LPSEETQRNITFHFQPEDGAWAEAAGIVPVIVPTVTPDPMYVSVGSRTKVTLTATGRGTPLSDIYVGLDGRGVDVADTNGTTGADGKAQFSISPSTTGDMDIHVGEEGRIIPTKLTVTSWELEISAPVQVMELESFTVTATEKGTGDPVEGATIEVQGLGTDVTNADGEVTFTTVDVTSDRVYEITGTKPGYTSDTTTTTVINQPRIYMTLPSEPPATGAAFTVKAGGDDGNNNGIVVTILSGTTEITSGQTVNGEVSLTVNEAGTYTVTATKTGYISAMKSDGTEYTIVIGGTPGFELLTLLIALGVAFILLRRRRK
jgi:hypothetical protein